MRQQICSCYKCRNPLETFQEVMMGICEAHITLLLKEDYYIGVCWECQAITLVAPKQNVITEKYIFSKGCRQCTGNDESNINWMTIRKAKPSMEIPRRGKIRYIKIKHAHQNFTTQ